MAMRVRTGIFIIMQTLKCDHCNSTRLVWVSREDGNNDESWWDNYRCQDCGQETSHETTVWDEDDFDPEDYDDEDEMP